ncbi:hypothetical protein M2650_12720 [Luteimonas sp. SX5]|uniref:Uncharacterized protein n=1 Tax=Luteimonas galliterrae TaxID=2940486 RepID=A0ABT0MMN5_9GAMM|nr:hypothetical protein [Luteimonas galliterrae]MCL1635485.1 hypothetical protein [Luteimonas galliterrae]
MRIFLATLFSSFAAVAVQPVVLLSWFFLPALLQGADLSQDVLALTTFMAMFFAVPFVLLLGIPLTLVLYRLGRLKWWPLALAGTIAGGLFVGWRGPGSDKGASSGGNWYGSYRDFVVDGEPTFYGWLSYLQSVTILALHGLIGATVFYFVWVRWMRPNNAFTPSPLRGSA